MGTARSGVREGAAARPSSLLPPTCPRLLSPICRPPQTFGVAIMYSYGTSVGNFQYFIQASVASFSAAWGGLSGECAQLEPMTVA